MKSESAIRVLVIDDHPLTADGIRSLLDSATDITVVGLAHTGTEGLARARDLCPDVAVVDLTLPDMSGLEVIASLTAAHPDVRVVVLTMHEDEEYVPRAARAGARGYLLKSGDPAELIVAVRAVQAGEYHFPADMAAAIVRDAVGDAGRPRLAPREREVLRRIAQGRLNKEIAAELNLSVRTVETYRARVMQKLDLHTVADLTRYAIAEGLLGT